MALVLADCAQPRSSQENAQLPSPVVALSLATHYLPTMLPFVVAGRNKDHRLNLGAALLSKEVLTTRQDRPFTLMRVWRIFESLPRQTPTER